MSQFSNFIGSALSEAFKTIGETATIGANSFTASFDEQDVRLSVSEFGDHEAVTTVMTVKKADLTARPRPRDLVTRVLTSGVYVVLQVQEDVQSYEVGLRLKNG